MIIEQIDNSKVLIVLGGKDMQDFSLKYNTLSFEDPHSSKILKRLLNLACAKTEISTAHRKILVEAVPHDTGCLILLTLIPDIKRKVYKVKKKKQCLCFIFNNTENLIRCCCASGNLKITEKNSLYSFDGKYAIIFENIEKHQKNLSLIWEFSDNVITDKIQCAKIEEKGKLLTKGNAIDVIYKHFK